MGHRFRVHNRDLPGSPDIANRSRRWAVFVNGCFWHRHGCKKTTTPTRNRDFWLKKFADNRTRDAQNVDRLRSCGWAVIVVWECELAEKLPQVRQRLKRAIHT
jgi:DNA mismatch endonuclease, patch repair protein